MNLKTLDTWEFFFNFANVSTMGGGHEHEVWTNGRVLGIRFDYGGDLVVADAHFGIYR
jgi:hypothetical protein